MRLTSLLAAAGLGDASVIIHPSAGEGRLGVPQARARQTGGSPFEPLASDDPVVSDVVIASGEVTPGALFACVKGGHADGHDYATEALRKGAVGLLCEHPVDVPLPQVIVPAVRRALGPVSAALWSQPSLAMKVVGVTGTNGKTTTCALLAAIFDAEGWRSGVIGTLTGQRTTPEAPTLQRRLAELRDQGSGAIAMEVSSHALDQYRVSGTDFAAGVFTNLSQDHLDYHHSMEAYLEAKAQLFTRERVAVAVVNSSDPWGAQLVERLAGSGHALVTYSSEDATHLDIGPHRSSFTWRGRRLELNMAGRFNVMNAVAAATTAHELGAGWDAVARGLATVPPVRGRFQAVDAGQPFSVLVDFAHTPAALGEALKAARELAGGVPADRGTALGAGAEARQPGRVIIVFGAGGDRDRAKRPAMGRVAGELADVVIVTSDNPRSERVEAIIAEVSSGATAWEPVAEVDRRRAIDQAIGMARPGDVVLVAGKGHETGQDFGDRVEPFDDVEVARLALARRWPRTDELGGPAAVPADAGGGRP